MTAPRVVVAGATSAIAQEAARCWAAEGASFLLAGRDPVRLGIVRDDLLVRGAAKVVPFAIDLTEVPRLPALLDAAEGELGGIDLLLVAHGCLPDQQACESSVDETLRAIDVNFSSAVALLTLAASRMERGGTGTIVVISSVAGDRGRASNYVYGSAKAGLTAFVSGLRGRLSRSGVRVVTVKPGFVDTPMTAHLAKSPLFASARSVGEGVHRAARGGRDVVYLPWWWALVMLVVKHVPERIFKKLKI